MEPLGSVAFFSQINKVCNRRARSPEEPVTPSSRATARHRSSTDINARTTAAIRENNCPGATRAMSQAGAGGAPLLFRVRHPPRKR